VPKVQKTDVTVETGLDPDAEATVEPSAPAAPAPIVRASARPMRGDAPVKATKVIFGCKVNRR
jgi:hypothetical protein